ncbi:MAG: hypothetical protein AAGK14_06295 [Verrucomicrobiota bacterium]
MIRLLALAFPSALLLFAASGQAAAHKLLDSNYMIGKSGIGPARLGMTVDQLKQDLGEDYTFRQVEDYLPDVDGIEVIYGGKVQYTLLFVADEPQDKISWLVTSNPRFKFFGNLNTKALGPAYFGPGSKLADLAADLGPPYLSFTNRGDKYEWIRFQNPGTGFPFNLALRARLPEEKHASRVGVYPNQEERLKTGKLLFETEKFNPEAVIESVWVSGDDSA